MAIIITNDENSQLNLAELAAVCGQSFVTPWDSWFDSAQDAWQWHCSRVSDWSPVYGWASGCTSGEHIGSRVRSANGSRRLLACRIR